MVSSGVLREPLRGKVRRGCAADTGWEPPHHRWWRGFHPRIQPIAREPLLV